MRKGGGKSKGSQFERQICVALSEWVTYGKRDDVYWRTAMSGGRATVRSRKGKTTTSQDGDISAIAPEGHDFLKVFFVECKFVKDLAIESALLKGTGLLASYWKQAVVQAKERNKWPLLIAKQNNSPVHVYLRFRDLRAAFGVQACEAELCRSRMMPSAARVSVCLLDNLLAHKYRSNFFRRYSHAASV